MELDNRNGDNKENNDNDNDNNNNKEPIVDLNKQIKIFTEKTGKDFTEFYNKYRPKLIYFANKFCKNEDEAVDYAEESFINSLEKIHTYDSEKAGFSTWLFTIARNHIFQNIKKSKRMPTLSMDTKIDEEGTTIKDFLSGDDIEDQLVKEKRDLDAKKAEIMMESIDCLKTPYRKVIKMREIDKLSYRDIASKLGDDKTLTIIIEDHQIGEKMELPEPISNIYEILDSEGNVTEIDFILYEGDSKKTPFLTHVKIKEKGKFFIKCRTPRNLSTIKSQIRNGRLKLQDMVKDKFQKLDDMYL